MTNNPLSWWMIESAMATFMPTSGGFSLAKRGIVILPSGRSVFVKLATEESSRRFIQNEIKAYEWLKEKSYPHIPELLLTKEGGLVLPDLSHLDWSNQWSDEKLAVILSAIDDLANIEITERDTTQLQDVTIENGWQLLLEDQGYYTNLLEKVQAHPKLRRHLEQDMPLLAQQTGAYLQDQSKFQLIHADIRADNVAYDAESKKAYIVDWNWMGLGRKGVEDVAFLANVARGGFDVERYCPERLDRLAAVAMAGFWFYHSIRRIWEGGDATLRELQFKSAVQVSAWADLI